MRESELQQNWYTRELFKLFLSLLAMLPFQAIVTAHYLRTDGIPTGFFTYDGAYYVANGRAVFNRGSGVTYPNPFDQNRESPSIYFHWLIWIFGFLTSKCGIDPALCVLIPGLIGAIATCRITLAIIEYLLPDKGWRIFLFFMTMWGGGFSILIQMLRYPFLPSSALFELFYFDPTYGWWFQNLGRNLILPTESIYHALMLAFWLGAMKSSSAKPLFWLFLICTTHPFTGLQGIAIAGMFAICELIFLRKFSVTYWFYLALITGGFFAYYFYLLPIFPEHRALQETWTLPWNLEWWEFVACYIHLFVFAGFALLDRNKQNSRAQVFLIAASIASFGLMNHQWVVRAHQPLHFARGYLWASLWFLGLPFLQRSIDWLHTYIPKYISVVVVGLFAGIMVLDNVTFLYVAVRDIRSLGFVIKKEEGEAFTWLRDNRFRGLLLTELESTGYLAAVYTDATPYIGHLFNTPNRNLIAQNLKQLLTTKDPQDLPEEADAILGENGTFDQIALPAKWRKVWTSGSWSIWFRNEFTLPQTPDSKRASR